MHHCIQGWTAIGRWAGVPVSDVLDRCKLSPEARYLVFHSYQRHEQSGKPYYEVIDLETARQTADDPGLRDERRAAADPARRPRSG